MVKGKKTSYSSHLHLRLLLRGGLASVLLLLGLLGRPASGLGLLLLLVVRLGRHGEYLLLSEKKSDLHLMHYRQNKVLMWHRHQFGVQSSLNMIYYYLQFYFCKYWALCWDILPTTRRFSRSLSQLIWYGPASQKNDDLYIYQVRKWLMEVEGSIMLCWAQIMEHVLCRQKFFLSFSYYDMAQRPGMRTALGTFSRKSYCSFEFCPNYLPLHLIWTTCTTLFR